MLRIEKDAIYLTDVHNGPERIQLAPAGTLVCDVDGTVADLTHRRVYVATKPKNWPAFEKTMHLDTPIPHVIRAVNVLFDAGWKVVMATGRGAQNREVTVKWLADNGVPYHFMYTRAFKDSRRDDIVKSEILDQMRADGHYPTVTFDDRDQVVQMWRDRGLPCVQVAEGNF
jgi:hypothetical protein